MIKYRKQKGIHIVRAPLQARVELLPCLKDGEHLSDMYKRMKREGQKLPIVLVNANFFHLEGGYSITGMKYSDGRMVERSLGGFYVYQSLDEPVQIDTSRGRTVHDFTAASWALESSPLLLPSYEATPVMEASIGAESHPRTAIGVTDRELVLLVTDGRPFGLTGVQLSEVMRAEGCRTALNLDGGRSSQLVLAGKQVNRQWFGRRVFTALAIYEERG